MNRNVWIILPLLCLITLISRGQQQIRNYMLTNAVVKEYEKAEWNILLSVSPSNPYDQKEISLDMLLTAPSGAPVVLPCYYDSPQDSSLGLWKARFAARETGKFTYVFRLTYKGLTSESKAGSFEVLPGNSHGFLHKNDYYTFRFDDGKLFRGLGENIGWESRSFEDPRWTYDYLLPTLSKNGANFFRTWSCPWNLPLEWKKSGNPKRYHNSDQYFNPDGVKRMEELLHLTDSLGLYFMLTLDMNSGNWSNNPYNVINGGPVKTWAAFFTSTEAMDKYKNKLRYLIARFGYSTHIAAWEFFNEIDNGVFNKADSILIPHIAVTNWHDEMSRYLKDIDPYQHLVTTSISHRDIAGLNSIAYIDFNQKHIYKHTEKIPGIYPDYIQTYGKPYVVGEFGFRWEDADPRYAVDADYDYCRGLWYGLFSPTPILPMSWWWEFFDDQHMTPYLRSVREISDKMLEAGKGSFDTFPVTSGLLHAQGMRCGRTWFVYLLNASEHDLSSTVSFAYPHGSFNIEVFHPETRTYQTLVGGGAADGRWHLDDIKLSPREQVILIVTEGGAGIAAKHGGQ
jgi:hypothetical protein